MHCAHLQSAFKNSPFHNKRNITLSFQKRKITFPNESDWNKARNMQLLKLALGQNIGEDLGISEEHQGSLD